MCISVHVPRVRDPSHVTRWFFSARRIRFDREEKSRFRDRRRICKQRLRCLRRLINLLKGFRSLARDRIESIMSTTRALSLAKSQWDVSFRSLRSVGRASRPYHRCNYFRAETSGPRDKRSSNENYTDTERNAKHGWDKFTVYRGPIATLMAHR